MSRFYQITVAACVLFLASCGQSGPLYLPKPTVNHHVE